MKQLFCVPSIHCSSCVMLLESLEEDLAAVKNVRVDLGRKTVEFEFDEDRINPEEIVEAIKQISGYEVITNDNR